jgi:hypothetical protein
MNHDIERSKSIALVWLAAAKASPMPARRLGGGSLGGVSFVSFMG